MESLKSATRQLFATRDVTKPARKKQRTAILYRRSLLRLRPLKIPFAVIPGCESDEESRFSPASRRLAFRSMVLEFHCHRFAISRVHFKKLPGLEAKHPGQNIRREGLDLGIQIAHHGIVVAAGVLNRVLSLTQRTLQLSEFLGSFQLRIILRHRKQALQRASKLIFSHSLVSGRGRLHGLRSEFSDVLKRPLFVGGVTLNRLDQVRNEVVTPFELHVNIGPG